MRLYQRTTGGWPKNRDMARVIDAAERARLMADQSLTDSTIDNGSTTTPLRFLARVHAAAPSDDYRQAFQAGIDYLLATQYANGGWPQYFPLRSDYSRHVTFNDDAMVNVLELLQDVAAGGAPFGFVDAGHRDGAAAAVARGVQLILTTQVRVDGRLTAWAAQYDAATLQPAAARTFEPVALSADESATIVRFLKALPQPSPDVRAAVEGAVAWFRSVRLSGLRTESRNDANSPRGWDRVIVSDPAAGPLWARFYEIGTNRPVFADRDSVVRYRLDALGYERRTGYAWYGTWPADIVR